MDLYDIYIEIYNELNDNQPITTDYVSLSAEDKNKWTVCQVSIYKVFKKLTKDSKYPIEAAYSKLLEFLVESKVTMNEEELITNKKKQLKIGLFNENVLWWFVFHEFIKKYIETHECSKLHKKSMHHLGMYT